MKLGNSLSIKHLARLAKIFYEKDWMRNELEGEEVFNRFINLLSGMDEEARELLLTLTEDFTWVNVSDYISFFFRAFDRFMKGFSFGENRRIVLCPLLCQNDVGKCKSPDTLLYLVKANLSRLKKKYEGFDVIIRDSKGFYNMGSHPDEQTVFCFVDDFIGSGEEAKKVLDLLGDRIPKSNLAILSLIAMEMGISRLQSEGYSVFAENIKKKGITGRGRNEEDELKAMEKLELSIEVPPKFKLGYSQSESLVKMIRTPNNTFPIYWYGAEKKNVYAPFPRW